MRGQGSLDADLQNPTELTGLPLVAAVPTPVFAQAGMAWRDVLRGLSTLPVGTETMVLVVPPGGEHWRSGVNLLHYGHHAQVNALA
ncbi:MAG: hypothetical protein CM1200mP29_07570 [Verrucomicrobiota bacterium]|nr:MAG: hypothetical protein CM1200mP29_07570 [Verrucomicrobiota bacterium]